VRYDYEHPENRQIGSSEGVTIPAKELKREHLQRGDEVKITIEPVPISPKHAKLMHEYEAFVRQYGKTLKHLADR